MEPVLSTTVGVLALVIMNVVAGGSCVWLALCELSPQLAAIIAFTSLHNLVADIVDFTGWLGGGRTQFFLVSLVKSICMWAVISFVSKHRGLPPSTLAVFAGCVLLWLVKAAYHSAPWHIMVSVAEIVFYFGTIALTLSSAPVRNDKSPEKKTK
jgi:hypothetical protein